MPELIKVKDHYNVDHFFYLFQGSQEMVGIGENSRTFGFIDSRTSQIVLLNSDFSKPDEQESVLHHEIGHGIYPTDTESERRRKDHVGNYGFVSLEYIN